MELVTTPATFKTRFKIVAIGDLGVGKTSLIYHIVHGKPLQNSSISISEFTSKHIVNPITEEKLRLDFWDTAGQEHFRSINSGYYRDADFIMVVYDITNLKSFLNLKYWLDETATNVEQGCTVILLGNKIDLEDERVIKERSLLQFAKNQNKKQFFTCALLGIGIDEVFQYIQDKALSKVKRPVHHSFRLNNFNQKKNKNKNLKFRKKGDCCL